MCGIYKITNQINGKVYIGQSNDIQRRWQEHKNPSKFLSSKKKLYEAFKEYGIENFSFEVLEECSREELDEKEIYYIEYYDSFNDGYNLTTGGQGNNFRKTNKDITKEIYSLWDAGLSVNEINEKLKDKIGHTQIYLYLHEYENYSITESRRRGFLRSEKIKDKKLKLGNTEEIKQYDLYGNFIQTFSSQNEAERITGVIACTIGRVFSGKALSAGGYQWIKGNKEPENLIDKVPIKFGVIQYTLSGEEVQRFLSVRQAAEYIGCKLSTMHKLCRHQKESFKGFKWDYDETIWNYQKR